jgi:hypothetical protein
MMENLNQVTNLFFSIKIPGKKSEIGFEFESVDDAYNFVQQIKSYCKEIQTEKILWEKINSVIPQNILDEIDNNEQTFSANNPARNSSSEREKRSGKEK